MKNIPIKAIANQKFSLRLDNNLYKISIRYADNTTVVSININNKQIIQNVIAVAGKLIIPSHYQEIGNFLFQTLNFENPNYNYFGITQKLIYFSASELASARIVTNPPITASYFNSIGALPLRFAPQGYL